MAKLLVFISAVLVVFAIQYEASPLEKIQNFKIDDLDDVMDGAIERGAAVVELLYSQAESLSKEIKKNKDKLPSAFSLFDFDSFKQRMNERKQKLSDYLETFKPRFEKNVNLAVEFLQNTKSSDKYVDKARAEAVDSVKALGEAVSGAVDGIKVVLSENDDDDDDDDEDDE